MPDWDVQGATNNTGSPLLRGGFVLHGYSDAAAPEPEPDPDVVAPVVSNYSPAAGATITPLTALSFDVTEESGEFCKIMVTAFFAATGEWEVIHTGDQFAPRYIAGSSRVPIANGFSYTVRRTGGWLSSPTLQTFAIDAAGNESV